MNLEELDFMIEEIKTGIVLDMSCIDNIYPAEGKITIIINEDDDTKEYNLNEWKVLRNTGIRDIDGNYIYEGNVVNQVSVLVGDENIDFTGVVKFLEGAWWITDDENKKAVMLWSEHRENRIIY